MLSDYFDEYSLNARVRPSLLVILPLVLSIYVLVPDLYELSVGIVSLFFVFGLITALSHFVRFRGRKSEKFLQKKWGGKPTSYLLREDNTHIDRVTKQRYFVFFKKNIDGWKNSNSESISQNEQNDLIESAIKWLLEKTRDTKKYNLIFKENISYGFRRNCFGVKWYGFLSSLISLVGLVLHIRNQTIFGEDILLPAVIAVMILSFLLCLWWMFAVTSEWVKDAGESYAIRLLAACEEF